MSNIQLLEWQRCQVVIVEVVVVVVVVVVGHHKTYDGVTRSYGIMIYVLMWCMYGMHQKI
eukprot:2425014-Pyramimonas_sp.AAC.1